MLAKWNIASFANGQQQIQIENKMLKFLQNQQSNRLPVKPLLKYQPELVYGHTQQSPQHFLNRHTIYFNSTPQPNFSKKTNQAQLPSVHNHHKQTIKPVFRHSSQQFNIGSQYRKDQTREKSSKDNRERGAEVSGDFNITRGQFSNFLDKHKHYRSIGTLHKQNKTDFSATHAQSMHKITWNKSIRTDSKSIHTNSIIKSKMSLPSQTADADRSILNNSKQSTFGMTRSNSVSIFEKAVKKSELKLRRDEFIGLMRKEAKEKLEKKYETFGLPRLGVEHQLFLLQKTKVSKRQPVSQMQEMNSDIDKFQQSLYYKFK